MKYWFIIKYTVKVYPNLFNKEEVLMDKKVTKDMLIGDMLVIDRGIGVILMQSGMHCVGCPSSAGETLDEACAVHGMDCDKVLADINEYLANK